MAYLLRTLLLIMLAALILTIGTAHGFWSIGFSHIELAIPTFIFTLFVQAFVMFYFIGVNRLTENVYNALGSPESLHELFDHPPEDLAPYKEKTIQFVRQTQTAKRQTLSWTLLIIVLGTLGFLLGGAHDTGLVAKTVHSGVIYGFSLAVLIGFARQWFYLGKTHLYLRQLKGLFSISDDAM